MKEGPASTVEAGEWIMKRDSSPLINIASGGDFRETGHTPAAGWTLDSRDAVWKGSARHLKPRREGVPCQQVARLDPVIKVIAKPIPKGRSKFTIVESTKSGIYGGHRGTKAYGLMDCKWALSWIAKGHYVTKRVFFHSEEDAIACGFKPCGKCQPEKHAAWKSRQSG